MRIHHSKELARNAAYLGTDQGDISFDGADADASVGIEPGTLVGTRTADKLTVAWDPEADDGSEVLTGILDETVHASGAGTVQRVGICARLAEVKGSKLFYPETVTLAEVIAALGTYHHRPLTGRAQKD